MAASWTGVAGRVVALHENIAWDGTEWVSLGAANDQYLAKDISKLTALP
jgi:hypothetical protein